MRHGAWRILSQLCSISKISRAVYFKPCGCIKNNEKGQLAARILRHARATSPLWTRICNWLPFKCCYHNAETATLRHFQPWDLGRALSLVIYSSHLLGSLLFHESIPRAKSLLVTLDKLCDWLHLYLVPTIRDVCTVQYSTDLPCSTYIYCSPRSTRQLFVTLIHRIDYLYKAHWGVACVLDVATAQLRQPAQINLYEADENMNFYSDQ